MGLNCVSGQQYDTPFFYRPLIDGLSMGSVNWNNQKIINYKMTEVDYGPLIDRPTIMHILRFI